MRSKPTRRATGSLLFVLAAALVTTSDLSLAHAITVTNSGFAVDPTLGSLLVPGLGWSLAPESAQGADLNGDGDLLDDVLLVIEPGGVTNTGLAVQSPGGPLNLSLDRILFGVSETHQGVDLNGDGDLADDVAHLYDSPTGAITNVALALSPSKTLPQFTDDEVLFSVPEAGQGGLDLNGDGDAVDRVLHVFDVPSGTSTSLGLAYEEYAVVGARLVVAVSEPSQGADLNLDGDQLDVVLHIVDLATHAATNLSLALDDFAVLRVKEDFVAFAVSESAQGSDRNGDGDLADLVAHFLEVTSGTVTNVGVAMATGGQPVSFGMEGPRILFMVSESGQSATDLNGDGDATDAVAHLFDGVAGSLTNLRLAASLSTGPRFILGAHALLGVSEPAQGTDLNGDGDFADQSVFHYVAVVTGAATNLKLAGEVATGVGQRWTLRVSEAGQSADLNGDGDATDDVLHVLDPTHRTVTNLGLASSDRLFRGGVHVPIVVDELRQGGQDLNGDGDALDQVAHSVLLNSLDVTDLGLAADLRGDDEHHLAILVSEAAQGGADLNGDGDAGDRVCHLFDEDTGGVSNLGLDATPFAQFVSGGVLALLVREANQAATDLNGDGDMGDDVLHHAVPPISPLDTDGDGVPDASDNCKLVANAGQADADADGFADACVSPDVTIPAGSSLGADSVIGPGGKIETGVEIGDTASLGTKNHLAKGIAAGDDLLTGSKVTIGRDVVVGDGVTIGSNVTIAEGVTIGDRVTIADGTVIKRDASIGSDVFLDTQVLVEIGAVLGVGADVGAGAKIGKDATVSPFAVVPAGANVTGGSVFP